MQALAVVGIAWHLWQLFVFDHCIQSSGQLPVLLLIQVQRNSGACGLQSRCDISTIGTLRMDDAICVTMYLPKRLSTDLS